ncbi:MAG: diguanylate cyclase [gamma proteobacterium symbiont of Taylorina sp.]|nr:diguanylate cyclase [gamma proteobacterium symbiont of Taylorina sp.]
MNKNIFLSKKYYFIFSLYFLGFGIIIALLTLLINYNSSLTDVDNKLKIMAKTEVEFKRNFLSNYISNMERLLSSITKNDIALQYTETGDKNNINNLFYALGYSNNEIMQLRYINASGHEEVRIDRNRINNELQIVDQTKLQDKSQRYYFKETSRLMANQFWHSNIDLNIEYGKIEIPYRPTFRVATPFFIDNQFKGIFIVNLSFKNILKILAQSSNFNVYLFDVSGEIIHHPGAKDSWSKYLENKQSLGEIYPEYINDFLNNNSFNSINLYSNYLGDLFNNTENLKILFVPKSQVVDKMKYNNIYAALLIAGTILFISIPLSWIASIAPSKLQTRLADAYDKIKHSTDLINNNVMISVTDKDGVIVKISSYFSKLTGYTPQDLVGNSHNVLKHPGTPKETHQNLWQTIKSGQIWTGEIQNVKKNGEAFWIESVITPEFYNGKIEGFTAIDHDITDKKMIEKMSITDSLTGLYNRNKLKDILSQEMCRFDRYNTNFSVIFFDIDFFKKINDTYGHPVGDDILIQLAIIIKGNIRETDIVSRWGGEEFLIVASESALEMTFSFAEKIRIYIEKYQFPDVGQVTISCGVAQYRKGEATSDLVSRADKALYEAKNLGRNRVVKALS